MACLCKICMSNEVDNPGDVCELCAISVDPYVSGFGNVQPKSNVQTKSNVIDVEIDQTPSYTPKRSGNRKVLLNGGTSMANRDPYGNDMTPVQNQNTTSVRVYSAGQTPERAYEETASTEVAPQTTGTQPITVGITKNITVDNQKKSILEKWFRSLFKGIGYTLDDDVTMFQVFPDYTGTTMNAMGNACDQVIVYGRLNNGEVSDNNEVEVYGRRDSRNNIIAKKIKNKATGAIIKPQRTIPVGIIWFVTVFVSLLIFGTISILGVEGIIWTAVFLLLLTNAPLALKIVAGIFGLMFSIIKGIFSLFK